VTALDGSVCATTPEFTAGIRDGSHFRRTLRSSQQPAPAQTLYVPRATAVTHATDICFRFSQPLTSPSSSTVDHHSVCMDQVVHRILPCATYPALPFLQLLDCRLETLPSSTTLGGLGADYACTTTHPGPAAQE
jgi:hypothetical protein